MDLNVLVSRLTLYVLVFCRMAGVILFNPILSRRNVPSQLRAALSVGMAILVTPTLPEGYLAIAQGMGSIEFVLTMMSELFIGLACGMIFQFFYYMLFVAGDIMDTSFGLAMAKVFDPGTNIQTSLSGNLFQFLFVMYIFSTNSHLILIQMTASSYGLVGLGESSFDGSIGLFLVEIFLTAFSLSIRLMLPFLAATFTMELAMGILMKLIPQISVFVIHFQLKIIMGLLLTFLFASPVSSFVEGYIDTMFQGVQELFKAFAAVSP